MTTKKDKFIHTIIKHYKMETPQQYVRNIVTDTANMIIIELETISNVKPATISRLKRTWCKD